MNKIILIGTVLTTLVVAGIVVAQGVDRNPATVIPSGQIVVVPETATDNSPALERIIFIHYKKDFAKPDNLPSAGKAKLPSCYTVLSKGAKLKITEDLVIHPDLELSSILNSANAWDSKTSTALFGGYTVDSSANWDGDPGDVPDNRNEFSFGNYSQNGVIAITVVWGYFSGPISTRKIVEFDIMFDTDFVWGDAAVNPSVMDLQNIATHEIGHGVGLADMYQTACNKVTMYGYSAYGETKKRTLEQPDIKGLQSLYGI